MRPSEFGTWSVRDQLQALALQEYEDLIGPCGQPHDVSTGDMEGWYEVNTDLICHACAAFEQYRRDNDKTLPEPGALLRVIDTRPDDRG